MTWITIVWSMNAAACLTLAGIYLLVWCKQREGWAHLLFSFTAVAAAAIAAFELAMMHAETVGRYEALIRWIHVPVWVLIVSLVSFVRLYLRAGRPWLAWSICGLRTLVLILDFIFTPNINFRHITSLRQFPWGGGEIISVPIGVANPWGLLSSVSLLLLLIFFVDATITVWRRGDRRRALVVGGSMIFGAILAWHVPLVIWGIIDIPFFLSFGYSGIVAAMAYELSYDLLHAAQLARQLQASEADLRETEQRMELAASAAKLGMWMWDIARNEIWITDKGRALFGFASSEKLDFDRFRSAVHPEDRELVLQAVENSLHTGAEYEAEYRVLLPDGQVRWIAGRGHVECNGNGQPARMRGAALDITKRKQAEEQFRLVVEAAPNAMIMVNTEGCITLVNTQAEAVFGYAREELIFHHIEMLVPERFRSNNMGDRRCYFCDARARPMGAGRELFGRRKDGSEVPIEIGVNPIHTSEGLFVLASIIDISERKQAELQAARQRNEMAHLSRVSTLGELSGSLAHELNLPLSAILCNAQAAQRLLAHGDADLAEVREILNEIVSEDKHAGEVIRRLRLWLKKGEVRQHSLRINKVVQDVLKLIRSDLVNQNVTADVELARNLPTVTGDPVQLQQVLVNLVVNACDAMTNCTIPERRLLIRTGIENRNGSSAVTVSVTDRGSSIPEEKMEQIFEPFFTTKAKGMGLGLSVCRTIIAAHRGKLWATNNADCGATFHFSLPIGVSDRKVAITNNGIGVPDAEVAITNHGIG
jgi:two-component system, LuxR family, sensor kinase FixL